MNKNVTLLVSVLILGLLGTACNKKGKLGEKSKSGPPTGPVELKLKWPKGEQIVKHMDTKVDMTIDVPNQPNPIKSLVSMVQKYGLTVAQEDGTGGHEVDMEFLTTSMKVEQGGKVAMEYDSENKSADTKDRAAVAFQKMFDGIIGSKLQYFLNATNGVDHIDGVDALMSRLASGGPATQNSGIKNMFNDASLMQMVGDSHALPPNPVQPADTWPIQMDMALGELGNLTINQNFTFARWEQHGPRLCARLEFDGTLKGTRAKEPSSNQMSMSIDSGTLSGVVWFDPEIGAIIDTDMTQDMGMTMTMTMPVRGGKPAKQSMKMQMHQTINVKLDSVK